jgi:hypothetical protein
VLKVVDFFASGKAPKVVAVSLSFLKVFNVDLGGDASRAEQLLGSTKDTSQTTRTSIIKRLRIVFKFYRKPPSF